MGGGQSNIMSEAKFNKHILRYLNCKQHEVLRLKRQLYQYATIKNISENEGKVFYTCTNRTAQQAFKILQDFVRNFVSTEIVLPDFIIATEAKNMLQQNLNIEITLNCNKARVTGRKEDVKLVKPLLNKMLEVKRLQAEKHLKSIWPRQEHTIVAPNHQLARFICGSIFHYEVLKADVTLYATVVIQRDRTARNKFVFRFRAKRKKLFASSSHFAAFCEKRLKNFLEMYKCCFKHFHPNYLSLAKSINPSYFEPRYSNCESLLVYWYQNQHKVFICGWRDEVDIKVKEFTKHICELVHRKIVPCLHDNKTVDNHLMINTKPLNKTATISQNKSKVYDGQCIVLQKPSQEEVTLKTPVFQQCSVMTKIKPESKVENLEHSVVAPNHIIARFIRYSVHHYELLKADFFLHATVVICIQKNTKDEFIYCFRKKQQEENVGAFGKYCKNRLDNMLENYISRYKYFNSEHLAIVQARKPMYFENKSEVLSCRVLVEWHLKFNEVLIVGLKDEVELKVEEISENIDFFISQYRPNSETKSPLTNHTVGDFCKSKTRVFTAKNRRGNSPWEYVVVAPDQMVARFIRNSSKHYEALKVKVQEHATVVIFYNIRAGKLVYSFQRKKVCVPGDNFSRFCEESLNAVLSNYNSLQKYFNRKHLMLAKENHPRCFRNSSENKNDNTFMKLILHQNKVCICGVRSDVDAKMHEIVEHIDQFKTRKKTPVVSKISNCERNENHVHHSFLCDKSDYKDLPRTWDDMNGQTVLKVNLPKSSLEYKKVVNLFMRSQPRSTTIVNVQRIQNPALHQKYTIHKNKVKKNLISKNPVDRELFHGTNHSVVDKICADGFNRGFCGKNGNLYGKGVYFATTSKYSQRFTDSNMEKVMILAQVLTGDFCKGNACLIEPPIKPRASSSHRLYDSVVDRCNYPRQFVVFGDDSVYPLYVITFKLFSHP